MPKSITYQLAESANYRANIAKIGRNEYDQLSYYFKEDFHDVVITRHNASMDIDKIEASCLWTVNGYVYNTVVDNNALYLPQATKSMLRSRMNKIGILNLSGVSESFRKIAIRPEQITLDTNTSAYEKVFITFDEPVQTPMLVMAGYLVLEHPEFFYRISETTFALRLHRLNYMEKLYELFKYRDIFTDLGVTVSEHNPTHVDAQEVRSEAVVRKFLTLGNSFMVDLQVPNGIAVEPVYLEHSTVLGTFRTHKNPTLPMFVGYGKLTEYHKKEINAERYSVFSQDHVYNNHIFSAQNHHLVKAYNGHRIPGMTHRLSNAFFLDIHTKS